MAEFNTVLRTEVKSTEGFYPVYISVAHKKKTRYIKTQYKVNEKGVRKVVSRKGTIKLEVTDKFVLMNCLRLINEYENKCNHVNTSEMDCIQLIEYLKKEDQQISFSAFADEFIEKMIKDDRKKSAKNYRAALNSLHEFTGSTSMMFTDITSKVINFWIESLMDKKTAKHSYPSHIHTIFNSGIEFYNDYDRDIIIIRNDPFRRVKIPRVDKPRERSVDRDVLRKFFDQKVEEQATYNKVTMISRAALAKDIGMFITCLAGINTVDLYNMKKENFINGKLCYNRSKTKDKREDQAYIEITVPDMILPLMKKYKGKGKNLFSFADRYADSDALHKYVNKGMKIVCKDAGIKKLSTYTFRHSWATIAQNDCGASIEDVGFALNHSSAHRITSKYIKKDFSRVDKLNEEVLGYIFPELSLCKFISAIIDLLQSLLPVPVRASA